MPFWAAAIFILFGATAIIAAIAGLFYLFRELWNDKQNPIQQGWDANQPELRRWSIQARLERYLVWQERDRKKNQCPGCDGTRCWDWRRNERSCKDNPTRAELNPLHLVGRHYPHTVATAVQGWWPLPRSLSARLRPDLWRQVAGHCQITLTRPRIGVALP